MGDPEHPELTPSSLARASMICRSYFTLTGASLIEGFERMDATALGRALFSTARVVVSHDTQSDPHFNYANGAALRLWEMEWAEFVGLPSRYSAEMGERSAREKLLRDVATQGFSEHYSGVRISSSGRRFRISGASVFNLLDGEGAPCGQAATFAAWTYLDREG